MTPVHLVAAFKAQADHCDERWPREFGPVIKEVVAEFRTSC